MKTLTPISRLRATAAAAALLGTLFWGGTASAAGTASNVDINNISLLSFSVGGVAQNQICSSPAGNTTSTGATSGSSCAGTGGAAGTFATFKVDNKVNLTVAEFGAAYTSVSPGSTAQVTTFTVTNNGNTTQDFALSTANLASGTTLFTKTDNFDATACVVRVDSAATATPATDTYVAATDTAVFIDELAADGSRTVYVVCNIPAARVNGDYAVVSLSATARAGGSDAADETSAANVGAALSEDLDADDPAVVEIVFADNDGGDDNLRDATSSDRDAYYVASAIISVSKTSLLLCDPFNGISNPKNIPGAIVRWTITISNASTATTSASLATVADTLSANTTFDDNLVAPTVTNAGTPAAIAADCNSATGGLEAGGAAGSGFKIDATGDTRNAATGIFPRFLTTAAVGADGASAVGSAVALDYSIALPAGTGTTPATVYTAGELKPGESVTVYFNVTIN